MKKTLSCRPLTFFSLWVVFHFAFLTPSHCQERITLDARMTQEGLPIGMVEVTCDGLDSTFAVMPDTATGQFRIVVPRGRCVLNSLYNEEIILDLQSDTVLELEATTQLFYYDNSHYFHSRQ